MQFVNPDGSNLSKFKGTALGRVIIPSLSAILAPPLELSFFTFLWLKFFLGIIDSLSDSGLFSNVF